MAFAEIQIESLQPQDRDIALLRGLFECRIMTIGHVATLFFDDKREYAKKRLQKLKAAGLIGERRRRVNEPAILFLARKAFDLLNEQGHLSMYPSLSAHSFEARANVSELTLRHELEIMDVKAGFHAALAKSERFSIVEFGTWPLRYEFRAHRSVDGDAIVSVKPDGFLAIHEKILGAEGIAHHCFLELDRSTETQETLVTRAGCYLDYYRSGGFAVRNGAPQSKFTEFPFRVLIVLKSAARRNNTAERLVQNNPPILTFTWLTTLAEVTTDPLGPIWIQPKGYREATNGTIYDTDRKTSPSEYRQQQRDALIDSKIKKMRLLER